MKISGGASAKVLNFCNSSFLFYCELPYITNKIAFCYYLCVRLGWKLQHIHLLFARWTSFMGILLAKASHSHALTNFWTRIAHFLPKGGYQCGILEYITRTSKWDKLLAYIFYDKILGLGQTGTNMTGLMTVGQTKKNVILFTKILKYHQINLLSTLEIIYCRKIRNAFAGLRKRGKDLLRMADHKIHRHVNFDAKKHIRQ